MFGPSGLRKNLFSKSMLCVHAYAGSFYSQVTKSVFSLESVFAITVAIAMDR